MNQMLSIFAKLDTFSVPFTQTIGINNQYVFYKSAFGGMVTIIILTFALIYSIDQLYTWGSGNMIYKVTSQVKNGQDEQTEELNIFKKNTNYENYMEFSVLSNSDSMLEPFYSDQAIILPLIINQQTMKVQSLLENFDQEEDLIFAYMENFQNNDYIIIFADCIGNEQYLLENQKCADQSLVDQFYQQKGLEIYANLISDTVDYSIDKKYNLYSSMTIPIEQQSAANIEMTVEFEVLNFKKGLLFQYNEQYILRSSYSYQTNFASNKYLTNYMEYFIPIKSVFFAMWMNKSYNYVETQVQYPSISEALANISSVTQTLFLIRYVINWINRIHMYESLKFSLVDIFYPEFKQIAKIKTGKHEKYFFNDQEIEKSSYERFKNSLYQLFRKKFEYISLIKEIYLMQKLIYQLCSKSQIINITNDFTEKIILTQIDDNKFEIQNLCQDADQQNSQRFDPFIFCRKIPDKQLKDSEIPVFSNQKHQNNTTIINKYQNFKNKSMSDHQIQY